MCSRVERPPRHVFRVDYPTSRDFASRNQELNGKRMVGPVVFGGPMNAGISGRKFCVNFPVNSFHTSVLNKERRANEWDKVGFWCLIKY